MGERSDQIEQEIRQKRKELSDNFGELEENVKRAVDWRSQFQRRPGTMLAVAFGGGVLLSALFRPRPDQRNADSPEPTRSSYTQSRQYTNATATSQASPTVANHREGSESLVALREALLGVALSRLTGIIDALLPGFQREFARAKGSRRNYSYESPIHHGREPSQAPDWGNAI